MAQLEDFLAGKSKASRMHDRSVRGTALNDHELFARYGDDETGIVVPVDAWGDPERMAHHIASVAATRYPDDVADAAELGARLAPYIVNFCDSAQRFALWRPWVWPNYRRLFQHWPWQEFPAEIKQ